MQIVFRLVKRVLHLLDNCQLVNDANKIRMLLLELAGVLKNHSAGECELLYPKLIAIGDLNVCKIARKHFDENTCLMFEIDMNFNKWIDFEITEDNAKVFTSEVRTIINNLIYRITMEDRELYPILDRL